MQRFAAIDFETADHGPDSACAIGMALVEDGRVTDQAYHLIRPPRQAFFFTYIHGIAWHDVAEEPCFAELWPTIAGFLERADAVVAHNAGFDRAVLRACCRAAGIEAPAHPYVCTVRLARQAWNLYPTKLPDVCRHLAISLDHHNAASDARACAEILVAALGDGFDPAGCRLA